MEDCIHCILVSLCLHLLENCFVLILCIFACQTSEHWCSPSWLCLEVNFRGRKELIWSPLLSLPIAVWRCTLLWCRTYRGNVKNWVQACAPACFRVFGISRKGKTLEVKPIENFQRLWWKAVSIAAFSLGRNLDA